jgi:hypothetical protein
MIYLVVGIGSGLAVMAWACYLWLMAEVADFISKAGW